MGVHDLLKNLKEHCPEVIQHFKDDKWSEFSGKTFATDLPVYSHKFFIKDTTIPRDRRISLLFQRFFNQYRYFKERRNITLLYVFDGKSPPEKDDEKKRRRENSQKTWQNKRRKINELSSTPLSDVDEEPINLEDYMPTSKDFQLLRQMMLKLGIPCLVARGEGEMGCVWAVKNGLADAIMTSDSDSLACGGDLVVFDVPGQIPYYVYLDDVLKSLKLTFQQFQDVCVTQGTDFNCRLPLINFEKAMNFIKKYGTLEKFEESYDFLDFRTRMRRKDILKKWTPQRTKEIFDVSNATPEINENDFVIFAITFVMTMVKGAIKLHKSTENPPKTFKKRYKYDATCATREELVDVLNQLIGSDVDHTPLPFNNDSSESNNDESFGFILDESERALLTQIKSVNKWSGSSSDSPQVAHINNKRLTFDKEEFDESDSELIEALMQYEESQNL